MFRQQQSILEISAIDLGPNKPIITTSFSTEPQQLNPKFDYTSMFMKHSGRRNENEMRGRRQTGQPTSARQDYKCPKKYQYSQKNSYAQKKNQKLQQQKTIQKTNEYKSSRFYRNTRYCQKKEIKTDPKGDQYQNQQSQPVQFYNRVNDRINRNYQQNNSNYRNDVKEINISLQPQNDLEQKSDPSLIKCHDQPSILFDEQKSLIEDLVEHTNLIAQKGYILPEIREEQFKKFETMKTLKLKIEVQNVKTLWIHKIQVGQDDVRHCKKIKQNQMNVNPHEQQDLCIEICQYFLQFTDYQEKCQFELAKSNIKFKISQIKLQCYSCYQKFKIFQVGGKCIKCSNYCKCEIIQQKWY